MSQQVEATLKGGGGVSLCISIKAMMDSGHVDPPLVPSLHDDIMSTASVPVENLRLRGQASPKSWDPPPKSQVFQPVGCGISS